MINVFILDEHRSSKQNGVGTYMKQILNCFTSLDVNVNFISFNSDHKEFCIKKKNNVVYYNFPVCVKGNFILVGELLFSTLRMYVEDNPNNVFFINHSPSYLFMKAIRKCFRFSKIVFTIHDQGWTSPLLGNKEHFISIISSTRKYTNIAKYVKKYYSIEKKMYNLVDAIICLSNETKESLNREYQIPNSKIHLIPNGICFDDLEPVSRSYARQKLFLREDETILLYTGRATKPKGVFALLKAFDIVYEKYPNLRLVIAGNIGNFDELTKCTLNSVSHITYTGLLSPRQLRLWYIAADIGILPSYSEQCSYTGIEMLSYGILTISTNGNGLKEMFLNNVNSLVANIDYEENIFVSNIADTIIKAIELTPEQKKIICNNAKKIAHSSYNINKMKFNYRNLLKNLFRTELL